MKTELMKIVERAVRPLVASHVTKLRMREDLYSQLELIYEEESAKNESSALENAVRRFGPPEPMTAELQQTVSRLEWAMVSVDHWFVRRRPGESNVGLAFRIATRMTLAMALYFGFVVGLFHLFGLVGEGSAIGTIWHLLVVVALLFWANAFISTLLGCAAFETFILREGRLRLAQPWRIGVLSLLAGTSFGISELITWMTATGQLSPANSIEPTLVAFVFGSGIFALAIYLLSREEAKISPWQALELAE